MKKYSKKEALRIITDSAKAYDKTLCGNCFLLCFELDGINHFSEFGFQAHNFKHFTGVRCSSCTSKQFYMRALSGRLSERDFDFDVYGNSHRKLAVLPMLPNLFSAPLLYGAFNRSGLYISADYFVGRTNNISLGIRHSHPFDVPVSLYCEDIRKLSNKAVKVLAVWKRKFGVEQYVSPCYCMDAVDSQSLLSEYINSASPCPLK